MRTWMIIPVAMLLASPAAATSPEAELQAAERAQVEAASARDVDRILSHYADEVIVLSPGERIEGKQAYAEHLAPLRSAAHLTLTKTPQRIDVAQSGDLAVVRGTYANRYVPVAGAPEHVQRGSYVAVYRRQADGAWRITIDMTAPEPAGAPSP